MDFTEAPATSRLLRPAEVAEILNIGRDTLRALFAEGQIERINIGSPTAQRPTWRVDEDELRRFIASRVAAGTSRDDSR